jgi:hypothetical protein
MLRPTADGRVHGALKPSPAPWVKFDLVLLLFGGLARHGRRVAFPHFSVKTPLDLGLGAYYVKVIIPQIRATSGEPRGRDAKRCQSRALCRHACRRAGAGLLARLADPP